MFAHLVRLPEIIFEMEDESAILVTVNTTLSILVPANLSRSATYLDITFDRISNTKMSKSNSQSQPRSQHNQSQTTTPCCMNIELTECQGWSYLMNQKARQASSVGIVFDYMPDAIAVNEALATRQAVSHDDNVSPSQLQHDPRSPVTEISTDGQDRSFNSEPATSMRVFQVIEADAVSCTGDDEAHSNIAEAKGGSNMGTLRTDRNTVLDSVRIPAQAASKPKFVSDTNNVTAEFQTVPGSQVFYTTHPPAARESPVQGKRQLHVVDNQQQDFGSDSLNDSSSQGLKLKHLRDSVNPPALGEQNEAHRAKITKANEKGLSRNLRDHNGPLKNAGRVQSHDGYSPGAYTDTNSKRASATKRASAARGQPQTQGASKARHDIVNGKISGQRGSDFQSSDHGKVDEPTETLDRRGRKSRAVPAPEASMVVKSNINEMQGNGKVPMNTSNISRPRPKPQIRSTQVPQRPSGSKAKKARSSIDEGEDVDWFEDIISDHSSGNATLTRNKTAKQTDIWTEPQKGKTSRAQKKGALPKKPATSQSTQKPRRAAAVKADMKIRGLADPINKGSSPGKKAVVKDTVKIKSASETATPSGVKSGRKPDISVKTSNEVKMTANRLEKDLSRQSPNVRAPATLIRSPPLRENSPSIDHHRERRKSDLLPAHAVTELTNALESNEDVAFPIKELDFVKESLVEPDAVVLGATLNGNSQMDKHQSMVEIATEQHAIYQPPDLSEESLLDEDQRPRAGNDRIFLRPQARHTAATLHEPEAIMDNTIEETSPASALSAVHFRQPEMNGGGLLDVHADTPELLNQKSKLSHHKSRSFKDADDAASASSKHLLLSSASQKPNVLVKEDGTQKRSTKIEHGFTARKLEAALSPILSLQVEDHDVEAGSILRTAREGRRVGTLGKDARAMGKTTEPQAPSESKVKAMKKRHIDEEDSRQAKKSRVAGWQPHQGPDGARAEIRTPKSNVPELRRKPVVVRFEKSGPKYERRQPPKKSKTLTMPHSKQEQDQHSEALQNKKRKNLDTVNDDLSTTNDLPNSKRRKGDHTKMQPMSRGVADALALKSTLHSSTGQVHRYSSQSSRVNEQGSPMPTVYSRKVTLAIPKVIAPAPRIPKLLSDVSGKEEHYNLDYDAPQISEPSVPAARHDTLAPIAKTKTVVGRNTKHRPSSPNAPSSIVADMTAHRIQPSGQFVGIHTNDVVVPQNPQDPFVETAQNRPASKFIEILRKYSVEQEVEENVSDNGRHKDRNLTTHLGGNDPDKTLIEENLSEDEESSTSSGSSSSSCSSESQSQADAEPSDDGSGSDSAWNKALRDDQRDIFEKLHEISHAGISCLSSWSRC